MIKNAFLKTLVLYFFFVTSSIAGKENFFNKGKVLFSKKDFEKSKILFEKDIVFNPKEERSYLYLAKIYNNEDNIKEEEVNLNNVLLLNPKNDEALFLLILIKIKQSNYSEAKNLIKEFDMVCKPFCFKRDEIQEKFDKIIPKDEKDKN